MEYCNNTTAEVPVSNHTIMEYCNNITLQVPDLPLDPFPKYFLGIIIVLLVIVTIAGNIMTITAYIIDKQLKTVYNTYIFNLAITDLFIGLTSMPFWGYYTIRDFHWYLGRSFCKVWLVAVYTLRLESVFMIVLLSYDRLLLIRFRHRYENKVTMTRTIVKIIITWIVAFAVYGLTIIWWDIWFGCTILGNYVCDVEFARNSKYTKITSIAEFFLSFKALLIINGVLYRKIRRLISKNVKVGNEIEGLTENDTDDTLAEPPKVAQSSDLNEKENTNEPLENKQDVCITDDKETISEVTEQNVSGVAINETVTDDDGKTLSVDDIEEGNKKETGLANDKVDLNNKDHSSIEDSGSVSNTEKEETKHDEEKVHMVGDSNVSATKNVKDAKRQSDGESPLIAERKRKCISLDKTHVRSKSDTTDAEPSEIMKSVMKVMEKHGSGILLEHDLVTDGESYVSNDAEIVDDSGINESATATDSEEILETAKPRNDLAGSLRRKISDYASRVLYKRQSGETVGLEKLKDNETYEERNIDLAIAEKERQDAAMAKRKASTQSAISSRIRYNTKAARFLAMLVVVFFVCWAPYTIGTIIKTFCKECDNKIAYEVLTWLLWMKSTINPFLYAYNSSRYRHNFIRFLSGCCRTLFKLCSGLKIKGR